MTIDKSGRIGRVFWWGRYPYMAHDYHSPELDLMETLAKRGELHFRARRLLYETTWDDAGTRQPPPDVAVLVRRIIGKDVFSEMVVDVDSDYIGPEVGVVHFLVAPGLPGSVTAKISIVSERFHQTIGRLLQVAQNYRVELSGEVSYGKVTDLSACPITSFIAKFAMFSKSAG